MQVEGTDVASLLAEALQAIRVSANFADLDKIRVAYLGKNGHFTVLLKSLGKLSAEDRPKMGQVVNQAKKQFEEAFETARQTLESQKIAQHLQTAKLDVTLPGRGLKAGHLHPINKTLERVTQFFSQLGFQTVEGPEIEEDYFNFEALNIPAYHPARAMHDTFYFPDGHLLRTHTSPVQIRIMQEKAPPFRLISPGRVYRCDYDVSHTPMFHQVEGLMIEEGIHFTHLKGILSQFLQSFFERSLRTRFRPSYFPFTEPSAEVDIECVNCGGKGCRVCSNTGWLEILGCGMVHPKVLENCKVDSEKYTGFAFGMGLERITMLRYGINDIRLFFENDLRFLDQF